MIELRATGRAATVRSVVAGIVTLLVVMLPALVAGAGIDQPVRDSELAWVRLAAEDSDGALGGPVSLFVRLCLDLDAAGDPARIEASVGVARLASVLGVFVCSGLLYLTMALARGRGLAILACAVFALLPSVRGEGAVLRPEVPCTMFALLALLLLAGMPVRLRSLRRGSRFVGWVAVLLLGAAVATADALVVATMPCYGVSLLVPAGCMLIVVAQQSALLVRVLRRFRLLVLPFRAFTLRTLPWAVPAFCGIVFSAALLGAEGRPDRTTLAPVGLWPSAQLVAVPLAIAAAVGGIRRIVQVGIALGRRARFDASAVLLVYVMVMLAQRTRFAPTDDALPAAPALAILVAEGLGVAMMVGAARLGGLRWQRA